MSKRLFIGGLPYATTSEELGAAFSKAGTVASATVITDKFTGRSRGFGFVEMSNDEEADKAIATLNNSDLGGRTIIVSEARPNPKDGGRAEKRQNKKQPPTSKCGGFVMKKF